MSIVLQRQRSRAPGIKRTGLESECEREDEHRVAGKKRDEELTRTSIVVMPPRMELLKAMSCVLKPSSERSQGRMGALTELG